MYVTLEKCYLAVLLVTNAQMTGNQFSDSFCTVLESTQTAYYHHKTQIHW